MNNQEFDIIKELTNKIEQEPNAENYINRANAYWGLTESDYKNAIADYTSALNFDNCPNYVYYNRGGAYFQSGDYEKALKDLNTAAKLLPSPKTYHGRGDTYRMLKQYHKAIDDYSKTLELQNDFPSAYKFRAECYYEIGNYLKAIDDYTKALETYSENEDIYNDRAFSYWQFKDKLKDVISDFSKVLELNPKRLKAYTDRGHAYYQNKEYEKSILDYQKFIELEETNTGDNDYKSFLDINFAYGRIGVNQKLLKQYDEAIISLEKSINSGDKCARQYSLFLNSLAFCYFKKGKHTKALFLSIKAVYFKIIEYLQLQYRFFNLIYKFQQILHIKILK